MRESLNREKLSSVKPIKSSSEEIVTNDVRQRVFSSNNTEKLNDSVNP